MRTSIRILTISFTLLAISTCSAQCNRGGRSSSPSLGESPSSLASSFANTSFAPQLASQWTGEQYRYALQQRMKQIAAQRRSLNQSSNSRFASNRRNSQREQLRVRNAQKALAGAERAEYEGDIAKASKYYHKVVRILGKRHSVSQQAMEASASLQTPGPEPGGEVELLASLTR